MALGVLYYFAALFVESGILPYLVHYSEKVVVAGRWYWRGFRMAHRAESLPPPVTLRVASCKAMHHSPQNDYI
jgi:hypothetical protein